MSNIKDSHRYCVKCKKRDSCREPCYPVEELLNALEVDSKYLPIVFIEHFQRTGEFLDPPESWLCKSKKEKIFELFFHDRLTVVEIACIVGCEHPYVSQIIKEIKSYVSK